MMVQKAIDQVHFIVFARLRCVSLWVLVLEKSRHPKKVEVYEKYSLRHLGKSMSDADKAGRATKKKGRKEKKSGLRS
jgi:hypothetical protein